jgi:hypothetical protein
MTIGSVWNMSMYALYGTAIAPLDTVYTGTQTNTAQEKGYNAAGRELVRFENDATFHIKTPFHDSTSTSYSFAAEAGDTIFSYAHLDDTASTIMMRSSPAPGQTWAEGSAYATVVGQEDVTVAAGTYKGAWKVDLTSSIRGVTVDIYEWFARGTGLVKVYYEYTDEGYESVYSAELTSATIK